MTGATGGRGLLEAADLDRRLSRDEYKARLPGLRMRLLELQRACWQAGVPSIVVIEGWQASGRGDVIRKLTSRLEPRGFKVHSTLQPRTHELLLPWMHRFWLRLPRYGQMAIFDRSWYYQLVVDRLENGLSPHQWDQRADDVCFFEEALAADGHALVKLFLHISGKEQAHRFRKIEADPLESWRIDERDWTRHHRRDEVRGLLDELMAATHRAPAPWTVVPATRKRAARLQALETVASRLEAALAGRGVTLPAGAGS